MRITPLESNVIDDLHKSILKQAEKLYVDYTKNDSQTETLLMILPQLSDYYEYLEFVAYLEDKLEQLRLNRYVQLATFHPDYVFADAENETAVENYTNRYNICYEKIISWKQLFFYFLLFIFFALIAYLDRHIHCYTYF